MKTVGQSIVNLSRAPVAKLQKFHLTEMEEFWK